MRARDLYRLKIIVLCLGLAAVTPAQAFDWASLWSSPEQRAAKQFESEQYDDLIETAPDLNWRALGEYRKGDYAAAAKSFEQQRTQVEDAGLISDIERAKYNQANAHVLEENYQAAMNLFDELIENNPQHDNAIHNRDIARQLLEQQQQEQQNQQQESGEQGEQNDKSQQEQQQDQQSDENQQQNENNQSESQNADQGEDENRDNQSSEQQAQGDSQNEDMSADQASADAQEQAEQDAAAAAALEAERARQDQPQQSENAAAQEAGAPLTEREQANEQWLRQIPDDPAGLLERKIQNRHLTDFPKVTHSDKPW